MESNKQIEEMAIEISDAISVTDRNYCDHMNCTKCEYKHCTNSVVAEILYDAGYRKKDEVINEFAALLKEYVNTIHISDVTKSGIHYIIDFLAYKMKGE